MSDAPRRLLIAGAVLLALVVAVIAFATVGHSRSSVVRTGGRITLEIPSGTLPEDPDASTTSSQATTSVAPTTTTTASARATSTTIPPLVTLDTVPDPHAVPLGGIYGQVVDATGTPLPGLCVRTPSSIDYRIATTGTDGTFVIPDVRTGPATVGLALGEAGCAPVPGSSRDESVTVVADLWVPALITVTLPGQA